MLRNVLRSNRVFAVVLATVGFVGGGGCTPPPPVKPQPTAPAADPVPTEPTGPDLTPVPAPAGLVGRGRARNLGATMEVASSLVGSGSQQGQSAEAARGLITSWLIGAMKFDIAPEFGAQIVLDAPVDVVATVSEADIHYAVSMGLASAAAAKATATSGAEIAPGVWALGGEKAKASCAIMDAAGAAPARLVCGPREGDVLSLGPYLVRTLAVEKGSELDLEASVDVLALQKQFGPMLRKLAPLAPRVAVKRYGNGNATFDKALEEGARFLAADAGLLLEDMLALKLEGRVDAGKGIDVKLRAELVPGVKSWVARTAMSSSKSRVPDMLWKMPADSSGAMFGTVVDPSAFGDVSKAIKGLVLGTLENAKVGNEAERKKVAELLELPFAKGVSFVGAGGFGRISKPAEAKTTKEKEQQHFDRLLGWYLFGTTQPADAWTKWFKDATTAFNQPGVQKALKKQLATGDTVQINSAQPPKELGKGASQINIVFSSKLDEKSEMHGTLMLLLMPDGESSWMAVGFDRDELVARLLRAKEGKDSLKGRADFAPLLDGKTNNGLIVTLQSFRSSVYAVMLTAALQDPKIKVDEAAGLALAQTDKVFAMLPQKGLAPMFVKTAADASANTLGLEVEIDKPLLDDLGQLVRLFAPRPRPAAPAPAQ